MPKSYVVLGIDAGEIIDSLPGLNLIIDNKSRHFRVLAANRAWLRRTKLKSREVIDQPLLDLFHQPALRLDKASVDKLRDHLNEAIRSGKTVDLVDQKLELSTPGQPAAMLYWDFHIAPLPAPSGIISRLLISIADKTEIARLEEHFHELLEISPDAIVVVGANSSILDVNDSAQKMFNYAKEELVGCKIEKLVPARYRHQHKISHAEYYSNPRVRPMGSGLRLHAVRKDGTEFPVEISLSPLLSGRSYEIAAIIRDVSEKVRSESQLRSSERRYRLLFNENPYPMFIYDPATLRILEVNEAAHTNYGYGREEMMQMKIQQIFVGNPSNGSGSARLEGYEPVGTHSVWETMKKDGSIMLVEVKTSFMDYYGKLAQQVLVNDVTDKIRLQKELDLQRRLKEKQITEAMFFAQEEEREHIGKELHDNINQLLATARLCFMSDGASADMPNELMRKGMKALDQAIAGIRQLSKGLVRHEIVEAGLVNSINDLINTINLTKKLHIKLTITGAVEENMKEDQKIAIYRIIQEQLSNILRHSHASHVHIDLAVRPYEVVLRIDDNGKGFNIRTARKGIGITNIINRAKLLDGDVKIDTGPDKGCLLEVQMKTKPVSNI